MLLYICVICGILASACSQLLLKQSAMSQHNSFVMSILNWRVLLSYGILGGSLLINITAFKYGLGLKELPILESLGYVFVPLLSFFFLQEKLSMQRFSAIGLIIGGVVIFYL